MEPKFADSIEDGIAMIAGVMMVTILADSTIGRSVGVATALEC